MGVIVSLTLDDGEEQRPHRENLFKEDYHKVGIACGPHETEFQMCVMDFAFDFQPLNDGGRNNADIGGDIDIKMNREDMMNNSNMVTKGGDKNPNNQSPVVKLSLENDDLKNNNINLVSNVVNPNVMNQPQLQAKAGDEISQLMFDTMNAVNNMKVVLNQNTLSIDVYADKIGAKTKRVLENLLKLKVGRVCYHSLKEYKEVA